MVAQLCGIGVEQLHLPANAHLMGRHLRQLLSLWCMGLQQSTAGSAKNSALINLPGDQDPRAPGMRAVLVDRPAGRHGRPRTEQLVQPAARASRGPPAPSIRLKWPRIGGVEQYRLHKRHCHRTV